MNVITVTGTPGTGKTALSVKLAKKLDFYYIDVNEVVKRYGLSERYDAKMKTLVIDVKKLNRALIKEINTLKKNSILRHNKKNSITNSNKDTPFNKNKQPKKNNIKKIINHKTLKKGIIIDSHLSHYLPKRFVDLCMVTKCNLKVLEKRLKNRKYSKSKARENLDAEIFDICFTEAIENGHKVSVIDTTKGLNIGNIARKIR